MCTCVMVTASFFAASSTSQKISKSEIWHLSFWQVYFKGTLWYGFDKLDNKNNYYVPRVPLFWGHFLEPLFGTTFLQVNNYRKTG